jgi:hypothetical protein
MQTQELNMQRKQVDKTHYRFSKYVHKRRWMSMWHQLDEVLSLEPDSVLEVGPGPGVFKAMASAFGVKVETLDLDPDLNPDYVASATDMPFRDGSFDVVCAFQMLEHLPFEQSRAAFREMARVSRSAVVISLPDAATRCPVSIYVPKLGPVHFSIPVPRLRLRPHKFNGQHHWEINRAGYPLQHVRQALIDHAPVTLKRSFRVKEYPYHRFFVFTKSKQVS